MNLMALILLLASPSSGKSSHTTVNEGRSTCEISSDLFVAASSTTIWDVLTDYDHASSFMSSVKESRVFDQDHLGSPGGRVVLVYQRLEGHVLWFTKSAEVTLYVNERPDFHFLSFKDVRRKDFDVFEGVWSFTYAETPNPGYWLTLAGTFDKASVFGCSPIKKQVQRTLTQVLEEIQHRDLPAVTSP